MECVGFGVFLTLLLLGWIVGQARERAHFHDLERREDFFSDVITTQIKSFPGGVPTDSPPRLVVAEVVIASDYFKSFLASLRNLVGGRVGSYQTLLERARREAILRLTEQADALGYNALCNVRLQTADVGGGSVSRRMPMAAILASATAYHIPRG